MNMVVERYPFSVVATKVINDLIPSDLVDRLTPAQLAKIPLAIALAADGVSFETVLSSYVRPMTVLGWKLHPEDDAGEKVVIYDLDTGLIFQATAVGLQELTPAQFGAMYRLDRLNRADRLNR